MKIDYGVDLASAFACGFSQPIFLSRRADAVTVAHRGSGGGHSLALEVSG
jgi:hypothetical protein